jgi:hypothetical protein
MVRRMYRLLAAGALLASACAGEDTADYRPLELDYLTQQIFEPSCGQAQCHSTFKQAANDVFDNPESVRATLVNNGLVRFDADKNDQEAPARADLIVWVTEIDPFRAGIGRMPYDQPLPNRDVKLLMEWIAHGAPGAQCDPSASGGKVCTQDASGRDVVVSCTADWNFDKSTAVPCTNGCLAGACKL